MPDELTTAEAAAALGLTTRSVRRLIDDGILPARRVGARLLLIRRADLARAKDRPKVGNPDPAKAARARWRRAKRKPKPESPSSA